MWIVKRPMQAKRNMVVEWGCCWSRKRKEEKAIFSTVHFPDRLTDRPTDGLGEKPVLIPTYALLTIATWLIITLVGYLRNESGMVIMLMEFGQPLQQNQRWTADNTLPKNCPSSVSSSSGKRSGSTDFINPPFWHESSMLLTVIGSDWSLSWGCGVVPRVTASEQQIPSTSSCNHATQKEQY